MMAVMVVQAQQRPSLQVNNNPAVFSEQNSGPIAFNPAATVQKEENFEVPTAQIGETNDDSLVRTKRGGHKGGYYGGYYNRGYYGYRYPYYSYNNG